MMFRFSSLVWVCLSIGTEAAFLQSGKVVLPKSSLPTSEVTSAQTASLFAAVDTDVDEETSLGLTRDIVSKLSWRQLRRELEGRELSVEGTTGALRDRLREALTDPEELSLVAGAVNGDAECVVDLGDINFVDESDPDFEFKDLLRQVMEKSEAGHWKSGSRRFKRLHRLVQKSDSLCIPPEAYNNLLQACAADRLHGARAAETARKLMELMVEDGYEVPPELFNGCIQNSLGNNPDGTHDGFGGIDTALAMLSAANQQEDASAERNSIITIDTYDKLIGALTREGGASTDDALMLLRSVIVEKSETPLLSTFANVAKSQVLAWEGYSKEKRKQKKMQREGSEQEEEDNKVGPEKVFNVLAYVKAAGYELETIASTEDGRSLLASGVIAADRVDSIGVGLRLLQAASKASGCQPDRGDVLVSLSSPTAQRACTRLHNRAINTAVENGDWQLSVKLLKLMLDRALQPSIYIWRNVVTCCAKQRKSRKATALIKDWAKLNKKGLAEKPPLTVFNTVLNACEMCQEHELTVDVLELMKQTHETEGNIITFNIALKRLAKLGYYWAPEGIIVGMIENGIEPSVVSYTTAIAACAGEEKKNAKLAYEWMKRMRSRGVLPNVITYDTAMAACLDGTLESTQIGSKIAQEMLDQVEEQLAAGGDNGSDEKKGAYDEFNDVIPHYYTKVVARRLMKQLKENWVNGDIDKRVATDTLRVPLLRLVEFQKSKAAKEAQKRAAARVREEDELDSTSQDELELEYSNAAHRTAEV